MAVNPYRNESEVKLAGKTLKLRMTFEAIAQIEEYFDAALFSIVTQKLNAGDFRLPQIVEVFRICTEAAEQPVLVEELQNLVMQAGAVEAISALVEPLTNAFAGSKATSTDTKKK